MRPSTDRSWDEHESWYHEQQWEEGETHPIGGRKHEIDLDQSSREKEAIGVIEVY